MEGGQISQSEMGVVAEQSEISRQQLNKTLISVQESLCKSFEIDVLSIHFSENPGEQNWSTSGCYVSDKKKWGSIKFGKEVPIKSNFLENKITTDELSKVAHEYTHIVTKEFEFNGSESTTHEILQEGVAIGIEVKILNSNSLYDVVDFKNVIAHCGRLVQENKDIILNPQDDDLTNADFDKDAIREILMTKKKLYDGFSLNRTLTHIAGIFFVGSVLGQRVDLADILYKNPPTAEEIVSPKKYSERVKIDLEQPIKSIQAVIPQIS